MVLTYPLQLEYSEKLGYNVKFVIRLEGKKVSLLSILQFPDPRLKEIAKPVSIVDDQVTKTLDDMLETMYEAQGVGLAAIQVNINQRLIVMDISQERNQPIYLVNPEIIDSQGNIDWEEGCLSFPGVYAKVKRHEFIKVQYLDKSGNQQMIEGDGLLSVCIQHEIDHLNGITFFDHLSPLKQKMLKKKLQKLRDKTL